MKRTLVTATITAFMLISTCLLSPVWATTLSDLAPFTGIWEGGTEADWREEILGTPRGGLMLGSSHFVEAGHTTFFEYFRIIEQGGTLILLPSPRGDTGVAFSLSEASAKRVVFENAQNDFPRTISYELREPDTLVLRITGTREGQSVDWQFDYRRR